MKYNRKEDSTLILLGRLYKILNKKRKFEIKLIILIIILNGLLEIFSIGSLVPLLTLISNPEELIIKLGKINILDRLLLTDGNLIFFIASLFFGLIILSNLLKIIFLRLICNTTSKMAGDISYLAYKHEINRDYIDHLKINSSSSISTITIQINAALTGLIAAFQLISSTIISTFIIIYLLNLNLKISLLLLFIISLIYILIINNSKFKLISNSKIFTNKTNLQVKLIQETFGNFREIIFSGNINYYLNKYKSIDKSIRESQAQNQFIPSYPRYLIELLLVILIFIIFSLTSNQFDLDLKKSTPIIGAFIFGSQRLLPAVQLIYASWTNIKAKQDSIKKVVEYINNINLSKYNLTINNSFKNKLNFKKLSLKNIYFNYGSKKENVIKGVNLQINKGDRIGFLGKSGSGKSTLLELISGLLIPNKGEILINNIPLKYKSRNLRSFQDIISYSPQETYLSDTTIAKNIALGINENLINNKKMKKAIVDAQLSELVDSLPEGINSKVGEKGSNLSGGQRQRIGLARAIYKNSSFLILDEFTSSLDEATEKQIMDIISNFPKSKTIIIVSHSKKVLEICNKIIMIEDGRVAKILNKKVEY